MACYYIARGAVAIQIVASGVQLSEVTTVYVIVPLCSALGVQYLATGK